MKQQSQEHSFSLKETTLDSPLSGSHCAVATHLALRVEPDLPEEDTTAIS